MSKNLIFPPKPFHLAAVFLIVFILITLATITWQKCDIYKDPETLWLDTLQKNPDAWIAHGNFGDILLAQGKIDQAITHYRLALKLNPNYTEAYNNLAWALATHPDPNIRQPEEAVRLVKHAYDLYKRPNIHILDTLAAAHAAAGRFDLALEIANSALTLATLNGNEKRAERIRYRIDLYKHKKPYLQPPPPTH
jgi:tetratricopeptide (TPR) repeat protein